MKNAKKIIIGVLVTVLAAGSVAGAAVYFKKNNKETVTVVSVDSIASDYYMDDTTLDGNIVTNVTQNVTVDKDMIVQDLFVQKGDTVKKGDKLVSFDMTLVQMELNIAKLKKQKQEQDLEKAVNRLHSLQNGGPIEEEDSELPGLPGDDGAGSSALSPDDEMASAYSNVKGAYLAAAVYPVLAAAEAAGTQEEAVIEEEAFSGQASEGDFSSGESEQQNGTGSGQVLPGDQSGSGDDVLVDFGDGSGNQEIPPTDPSVTPSVTPSITPTGAPDGEFSDDISDDIEIIDPEPNDAETDITDGEPEFYQKLDGETVPFTGTGTEEDPFVFLCSSAKGKVVATGAFLNKMAGFQPDGTKEPGINGYWYQLEFHQNDTIADFSNRKLSCTGYYLIDGSLLENMVEETAEMEYTLEGASHYEEDPDIPDGGGGDGGDQGTTISRDEAIANQKNKIESLKLDIRESEISITKLEKKVSKEVIYSKIDGVVAKVGDPLTGVSEGNAFMTVKSKDGYYVKGTVSELMLDQVEEGTILNCSGSSGSFDAEVVDVSSYPGSSNSFMGNGNPNVSYYTYSATILDKDVEVSEDDWLSITLKRSSENSGVIVLDKAFVRSENGKYYVYMDENGSLKKQFLTIDGNVNGGSSVLVKDGITREDKIAFPYGKSIKEGIKTKEGTLEELYGY
ncbi:MAG: hypothetical protein SOR79_10990 [Blautia sp.]|uniref:hypothetical protein n=1 Tax=Blautia sp. TaxID=1955243 RepID=UPI002A763BA6|nr:hypothetical protein [Blautia sp.]MDY3017656.1 hypothetical protein [Blautia sp.]